MKTKIYILALLVMFSCEKTNKEQNSPEYKLVWEETFEGEELNADYWNIEVVAKPANKEYQYYRKENISLGKEPISGENCLIITAKKENFGDRFFTSGRLNTMSKVAFQYGRLDARVKLPKTANGLWPAFWMKGNDNSTVPWPKCGELDILEMGHSTGIKDSIQERYVGAACHWGNSSAKYYSIGQKAIFNYSVQGEDFHLYTLIWDKEWIKVYLDLDKFPNNKPYYKFNYATNENLAKDFFQKEYYILFNLAVGGGYTGITETENIEKITALNAENNYEAKMYVDFIRIYQQGSDTE